MNDALAIAQALIRCPSVTPQDAGALGVLENLLKPAGFEVHRVTFSEPGFADVDNLYARIGKDAPHIAFAGHTDVVPAGDEAAWKHGAFAGEVKDGFLYGRGAVDMKGGIACSVAAVLQYLAANGGEPKGSISFLITGDEEDVSINGTIKLLQWASARGEKFDHCVLGEPSNQQDLGDCIKVSRCGSQSGTLYVDGLQGHVAYPQRGSNPVPDIARLIVAITDEPLDRGSALFKPLKECGDVSVAVLRLRNSHQDGDPAHFILLCVQRQRPRGSRSPEKRDELASLHSIISSARLSSETGTETPSVFAVRILIMSSTFVDCCTGRSAGFSPLRIRPV
jgi:succinyl-diaminopimelate desuccinylase